MKRLAFIIAVASAIFFGACDKPVDAEISLTIKLQHCADNIFSGNDIHLCFDKVVADSRCPYTADCIWAGAAAVEFTLTKHNETHLLKLSTISRYGDYTKDTTVAGYKIELLDLLPYPDLPPNTIPANEAKVKVTKL
jgi:hypothetical protein